MNLEERVQQVHKQIEEACLRSGRSAEDVNIVAVTKYVSTAMAAKVLDSGLEHLGENRWQNAEEKWNALGQRGTWHFIGHLQSNKVKDVIGKFEYIHSLDRLSLAKEMEKSAAAQGLVIKTFVQVNISGEDSKYGLAPEDTADFLRKIQGFSHIRVIGLMTMAPFEDRAEDTRMVFRGLRELRDDLNLQGITKEPLTELSMGMSNDFEVAIEEGATWIRLGSVLVGKEEEE
ncbi:YggS family pyridoxal phosphate-dependent enzyme [Paenibacillus sp. HJL G12]|uniref:Pyridoxal phosphate homeostasis protein n=1 Tax=Paenibacillus dendrobii TaxID=2691084 RepID=A0A7X3IK85_9BACL|nr:YggS family pyridoxal phosphate-dependent enzyme [Paenibacillus dendrobii]MWV45220.1 YggS family pyridoxal phosphate-dependent enzyme [Paenibacillus dendrobii]